MSNYVKATDFASKDALTTGDPNKKIKGTEINTEFNAISTAIATKADLASPVFTGTPQAPLPSVSEDSTRIATTEWVRDFLNAYEPIGTIKIFAGAFSAIPTGWQLCDGTNGTFDLRDKFVIGAKQEDSGVAKTNITGSLTQTGGSKDSTLAAHNHGVSINSAGMSTDHTHSYSANTGGVSQGHTHSFTGIDAGTTSGPGGNAGVLYLSSTDGTPITVTTGGQSADHVHLASGTTSFVSADHIHNVSGNTASSGSGSVTNTNLPPYFAVAFIQKIANA